MKDRHGTEVYYGDKVRIFSRGLEFVCRVTDTNEENMEDWEIIEGQENEHMFYSPDLETLEVIE